MSLNMNNGRYLRIIGAMIYVVRIMSVLFRKIIIK